MRFRTLLAPVWLFVVALPALAQTAPALSPADRTLARSIFSELIGINTSHSVGSTTVAARAIQDRLLAAGFPASDIEVVGPDAVDGKRKNVLIHWPSAAPSSQKPVLFMCHLDVVEAPRDQWQTDPFVLTERDGYFYGRGTQDIKDCDSALVTDLILLQREHFRPDRELYFAFTADEEGGDDNGVEWLFAHKPELKNVAFVINPDSGELAAKNGKPYALLYQATEKVYADYELAINGPGGHSSLPEPDNIIDDLAAALLRIQAAPFPVELNGITRNFFQKMSAMVPPQQAAAIQGLLATPPNPAAVAAITQDKLFNGTLRTTCVVTLIHGGEATNALPANATANVNCRILPGHSREEIRQQLIKLVDNAKMSVTYKPDGAPVGPESPEYKGFLPPPPTPAVFGPLESSLHALFPGLPLVPLLETGASDCIYPAAEGVACYGINGFPQDLDDIRYHARDERLRVESYYTGVEFYKLYIQALAGK
jgi:acetylornithine deacetylase/succinyl-diaminopimelate desuccinylase-like protein